MVADIGGTNTRFGLFDPVENALRAVATYTNRAYPHLEDAVAHWLDALEEDRPEACCIAIASPLSSDRVDMTNMDWSFSRAAFAQRFPFRQIRWLNDFEANAYALPHLSADQRLTLQVGCDGAAAKLATVGPGTGLGGATLQWVGGQAHACACEPGHMGLSPGTAEELELFRAVQAEGDEVYVEQLVSGPGLQRLYRALGTVRAQVADQALTPADISNRGLAGEDALCIGTLETFCKLLGSVCGDFVLANGAYGGLYLAGGILPRMGDFLQASDFLARFAAKGAMAQTLAEVPIYTIIAPQPGLIGAAHAPL